FKIFFDNVIPFPSELEAESPSSPAVKNFVWSIFPDGFHLVELYKQPFYCVPELIRSVYLAQLHKMGIDDAASLFAETRISRQAAGIVSPPFRYQGLVSAKLQGKTWNDDPKWFKADPPRAINLGVNAVFDLNHNPNFECFFFKHTPFRRVEIDNLDLLWPPASHDFYFNVMLQIVSKYFLTRHNIDGFNPLDGVIDRGYASA
ncbi:MAG TPA: hypothetical protein VN843_32170, partial [Anaerolineales bacterium]|nr:hypothetical protein [Anaerolineales bacterium]